MNKEQWDELEQQANQEEMEGKYQVCDGVEQLLNHLHSPSSYGICLVCGQVYLPKSASDTHCSGNRNGY